MSIIIYLSIVILMISVYTSILHDKLQIKFIKYCENVEKNNILIHASSTIQISKYIYSDVKNLLSYIAMIISIIYMTESFVRNHGWVSWLILSIFLGYAGTASIRSIQNTQIKQVYIFRWMSLWGNIVTSFHYLSFTLTLCYFCIKEGISVQFAIVPFSFGIVISIITPALFRAIKADSLSKKIALNNNEIGNETIDMETEFDLIQKQKQLKDNTDMMEAYRVIVWASLLPMMRALVPAFLSIALAELIACIATTYVM